jgi:hypothetical protein
VHEGGVEVTREGDGRVTFRRPDGAVIDAAPMLPVPCVIEPTGLAEDLPIWDGAQFDLVYAIDVLLPSMLPTLPGNGRVGGDYPGTLVVADAVAMKCTVCCSHPATSTAPSLNRPRDVVPRAAGHQVVSEAGDRGRRVAHGRWRLTVLMEPATRLELVTC